MAVEKFEGTKPEVNVEPCGHTMVLIGDERIKIQMVEIVEHTTQPKSKTKVHNKPWYNKGRW